MLPQISQHELSYERLRLLLEINNAVVTHLDLHELLHATSQTLQDVVPHDFTALAIYDEETKELRAHAIETGGRRGMVAEGTLLPLEGTFAGVAISTRQTVRRDQIDLNEFHAPMMRPATENLGLQSVCVTPLFLRDRIVGAALAANHAARLFENLRDVASLDIFQRLCRGRRRNPRAPDLDVAESHEKAGFEIIRVHNS